jgi:hypothetical protein
LDLVKLVEERLPQVRPVCSRSDAARAILRGPSLASAIGYLYGDLGGAEVEREDHALIEEGRDPGDRLQLRR